MSDDEVKRILYVQTSGVESPARSATVFFLAASAAAMDVEVGIYFTQTGPTLLQRGTPGTLRIKPGGATLSHFMDQAREPAGSACCVVWRGAGRRAPGADMEIPGGERGGEAQPQASRADMED